MCVDIPAGCDEAHVCGCAAINSCQTQFQNCLENKPRTLTCQCVRA
jgi:hypothetical protein